MECLLCAAAAAKSLQSCLTLWDPADGNPPGSPVPGILQGRTLEWVAMPSPGDCPNAGIEPRSPTLWADSLPSEPPGKPKNTGVGTLSLLQQIFRTQQSNQGLLHCKQILYHLSYQGISFFLGNTIILTILYCSSENILLMEFQYNDWYY